MPTSQPVSAIVADHILEPEKHEGTVPAKECEAQDAGAGGEDGAGPAASSKEEAIQMTPTEDPVSAGNGDLPLLSDSCLNCLVVRWKKTGECKGFCFLEFLTLEAAEAAILVLNAGVQVAGAMVAAQLARQNSAMISGQIDKHNKSKVKATRHFKAEVDLPQLRIQGQIYSKNSSKYPDPPSKRNGVRANAEEKKSMTYSASVRIARDTARSVEQLRLRDREKQLELQDEQLRLSDQQLSLTDQ